MPAYLAHADHVDRGKDARHQLRAEADPERGIDRREGGEGQRVGEGNGTGSGNYGAEIFTDNPSHLEAGQLFTVTNDGQCIGRGWDSRRGGRIIVNGCKFPLGVWKEGEKRTDFGICSYCND